MLDSDWFPQNFASLWLVSPYCSLYDYLRLTVKISQFLRLSAEFLAVLRLSVNPIETLLCVYGDEWKALENYYKQEFSRNACEFSSYSYELVYKSGFKLWLKGF